MLPELVISCEEGLTPALSDGELTSIVAAVLAAEGVMRPCSVSLSWVSDEHIAELNAEWRQVAGPTDVLSFECERPDEVPEDSGVPVELGDIVLAPDYIARQATRFSTTAADETRLMVVHAMLHLLGYDHLEAAEAKRMHAREESILATLATDGTLTQYVLTNHREDEPA